MLFKEMLLDIGYDDMSVVTLLSLGVRVVGVCENSGIWATSDDKMPRMQDISVCEGLDMQMWEALVLVQ